MTYYSKPCEFCEGKGFIPARMNGMDAEVVCPDCHVHTWVGIIDTNGLRGSRCTECDVQDWPEEER